MTTKHRTKYNYIVIVDFNRNAFSATMNLQPTCNILNDSSRNNVLILISHCHSLHFARQFYRIYLWNIFMSLAKYHKKCNNNKLTFVQLEVLFYRDLVSIFWSILMSPLNIVISFLTFFCFLFFLSGWICVVPTQQVF